ncbi:MAG: BtrH N-terminal domain-containing protein [Oligoflexales bacterium]
MTLDPTMPDGSFKHFHAAHCESGVTSSLLNNIGVSISEAMCLGIGSGLFFVYAPFVKVMGLPLISFRSFPGTIFQKTCKRLGISYSKERFLWKESGIRRLDQLADRDQSVGIQTNIFWLPYVPRRFRFHFNAHNIIVFGKDEAGAYRVSDPCLEETVTCQKEAINRARFSRGPLAPRGLIYYPKDATETSANLKSAIKAGIRQTCRSMLGPRVPYLGVRGINFLGQQLAVWPDKIKDEDTLYQYLASIVRMQEEVGTGGAGFRYLYASFLQESGRILASPELAEASMMIEEVGDQWRHFGTEAARTCKKREIGNFPKLGEILRNISNSEKQFYLFLQERCL